MDESMSLYWELYNKTVSNEKLLREQVSPLRLYESDFVEGAIIDIGCGQSDILLDYTNSARKIVAIDNEQSQLDMLKCRAEKIKGVDINNWSFTNLDILKDNLPKDNYSVIVLSNILHFFTLNECSNIERKIYELGKKGTLIYIVVHSEKYYNNNPENPNNNEYFKHYFSVNDLKALFSNVKYDWLYTADVECYNSKDDNELIGTWIEELCKKEGITDPKIIKKEQNEYLEDCTDSVLQLIIRMK